jgi:hypothetical protein
MPRHMARGLAAAAALVVATLLGVGASPSRAEPPATPTLLADLGLKPDEITQVQRGGLLNHSVAPASERELVAGFVFQVAVSPSDLVKQARKDLLDRLDPSVISFAMVPVPASLADFAKLELEPETQKRVQAYLNARPGEDLNLSPDEIAAFRALGSGAAPGAVEEQVRKDLLARLQAYRARGLAGIAPYARAHGQQRSPADELRTATEASRNLARYAPAAYRYLLFYPEEKPEGAEEVFHWTQFEGHGVPTLSLTHVLLVPDGDAWIAAQREFYVSTGYNVEQAVAAFLPTSGGTVVVYVNRTSTDQVTGFGGDMKRKIGSNLLASQLQQLFERVRTQVR